MGANIAINIPMLVHTENKFLPYTAEQMYVLVNGVEYYPDFLPWCVGTRVRNRQETPTGHSMEADMIVGFKGISERYTCTVVGSNTEQGIAPRIDIQYLSGPFKHLYNHWIFTPTDGGCMVDFRVEFEFKSRVMSAMLSPFFEDVSKRMVSAFEKRAETLYGQ